MRLRFYAVIAATILFFMCPFRSWGQEEPQLLFGGFDTTGTVSAGYRFTSIKGDMSYYNDLFNLHSGFRLMDVNLMGRAPQGSHLFADSYSITASGLGGDPYATGQLTLRKDKLYDLTVSYRQSYYNWSQNNNASQVVSLPLPSGFGVGNGLTPNIGLTPNHSWSTVRRIGTVDLNVRATNNLRFSFNYSRNSRNGMTQATRNMFFNANDDEIDASISPGYDSFVHATPYLVAAPINELTDRITGGFDYTLRKWTFHYRVGYQSFSQNESWNNLLTSANACPDPNSTQECSIDTSTAVVASDPPFNFWAITQNEGLNSASWSEFRHVTTPISEFSFNGKANSRLELRGSYNYYSYRGPDTTNANISGNMRAVDDPTTAPADTVLYTPYFVQVHNRASVTEPIHEGSVGLTAKITEWWNFFADYRYTHSTSDGFNNFNSIFTAFLPGTTTLTAFPTADFCCGTKENKWTTGIHFVDLNMEFTPTSSLVIRAGIRYVKRDVIEETDGVQNTFVDVFLATPFTTVQTKSIWPTLSVFYKPVKIFSVRGDFQSNTSSVPYTPISAHTDVGSRFVFRLQPTEKISIEDNLQVRDRMYAANSYRNRYRTNAINIYYDFNNRFSVNAGYSYESLFGADAVLITEGTLFSGFQQDAFINRGWRGGFILKPTKRFGINVSGNYLRTTGASQYFSTEVSPLLSAPIVWLPSVGRLTWPMMTATLYYDFPKAGRLSLDLQRTYYVEQLVKGNNFQADLLTIKWTKNVRRE
jgi:hypothetical protein